MLLHWLSQLDNLCQIEMNAHMSLKKRPLIKEIWFQVCLVWVIFYNVNKMGQSSFQICILSVKLSFPCCRESSKDCLGAGDMTRPRCDDDVGGEGRLRDASPALHRAWALTLPASVWLCGAVQYGVLVLQTLVKISTNSLTQKLFCSKWIGPRNCSK